MSDHSLMNPNFLQKELNDASELYARDQTFTRELQIDLDRIRDYFIQEIDPKAPDVYTISSPQMRDIMEVIGRIHVNKYRLTSGREVAMSQYKQLLQDRRYRIATAILNFFKK